MTNEQLHPDQHNRQRERDAMTRQIAANKAHRNIAGIWSKAAMRALARSDYDVARNRFDAAIAELEAIR
jgi:hypothetical protein